MPKAKDDIKRESYSVRLDPALIRRLKHIAVDRKQPISSLIEEAIRGLLEKHKE